MWFPFKKRKTEESSAPRKMIDVIDQHMGTYVRHATINNSMKTGIIMFSLIMLMFNMFIESLPVKKTNHIASIAFLGTMTPDNAMANAREFSRHFNEAIKDESAKAIMIIANSGGGSPTQAEAINNIVKEYTSTPVEDRKPVIVTIQEVCASACVLAFASADKIYSHANSMVGSISVRMDGWAIDKALARFDIERKVIATGPYKDLFDPYKNLTESEKEIIRTEVMGPMHNYFVNAVKEGRKDKLDLSNEKLFTGMVWAGQDSVAIGLTDAVITTHQLEEQLKSDYSLEEIRRYNKQSSFSLKNLLTSSMESAIRSVLDEQMPVRM